MWRTIRIGKSLYGYTPQKGVVPSQSLDLGKFSLKWNYCRWADPSPENLSMVSFGCKKHFKDCSTYGITLVADIIKWGLQRGGFACWFVFFGFFFLWVLILTYFPQVFGICHQVLCWVSIVNFSENVAPRRSRNHSCAVLWKGITGLLVHE